MKSHTYTIEGMSCNHCVMSVRQHLAQLDGIDVEDVQIGKAVIAHDEETQTAHAVEAAIASAGFRVSEHD